MMSLHTVYQQAKEALEDFWGRKWNTPRCSRAFLISGLPVQMVSNEAAVLAAADFASPLYSVTPTLTDEVFRFQIVVQAGPIDPGPAPDNLVDQIQFTGDGEWMAMQFGGWGHCHIDYMARWARAVVAPAFAARPDLISQCMLNTVFTNYMMRSEFAMLHATGLVRKGRILLLLAPHNSGKSTTALRLVMDGYQLLSDSHVYVVRHEGKLLMTGFPVGRIKLRRDMVDEFPQLARLLTPEAVRRETKYAVDLRRLELALVYNQALAPEAVDLCLLRRNGEVTSALIPATHAEAEQAIIHNSMHYDTDGVWANNLMLLEELLARSRCYHLHVGSAAQGILEAVAGLS
jgi:hypothetical protein